MEQFILVMLGVNLVLTIVYAGCCIKKGNRIWLILFFLALPIMGFLLYFVPGWLAGKSRETAYNREKLVHKSHVMQMQKTPDISKTVNPLKYPVFQLGAATALISEPMPDFSRSAKVIVFVCSL